MSQPYCLRYGHNKAIPYCNRYGSDSRHPRPGIFPYSHKEIADRAGHRSVVTVLDRYGHLLPGTEDKVNDARDAMHLTARSGEARS